MWLKNLDTVEVYDFDLVVVGIDHQKRVLVSDHVWW